jgi:predicted RNA methylase
MRDVFDTIVMNPPFGTKNNEGIDMELLESAVFVISDSQINTYI